MRALFTRARAGITLLELLVVVAIIGILAAVAIPVFRVYITRSKAAEAANVLQGIRQAEEDFYGEFRRYTDPLDYMPDACANQSRDARPWVMGLGHPWLELGFAPDGPTYYSYQVLTSYAGGVFDGSAGPPDIGTDWTGPNRPWFVAQACGDLDLNNVRANFYLSSANKNIYHDGAASNEF
jgi:prepilin-type N-terminal cleavage/methylation domain-containing protein